jgi:hypothetical protein
MTGGKSATQFLLEWRQSTRGARAMPARAEVDPLALKAILPNLLIDVAPGRTGRGMSSPAGWPAPRLTTGLESD